MRLAMADGVAGARGAGGTVVVIDVLRAFTVSAYALDRGATECRLVREVDEALSLARSIPGSVISAEVGGLPVAGVAISNSPTQILATDVKGRVLIQRSSAGTQAAWAARGAKRLYAASLVVASATARAVLAHHPDEVTIVASGHPDGDPEDRACAACIASLLEAEPCPLELALRPLYESERYRRLAAGEVAGFAPSDLELALHKDRFDFAMEVTRDAIGLVLRKREVP